MKSSLVVFSFAMAAACGGPPRGSVGVATRDGGVHAIEAGVDDEGGAPLPPLASLCPEDAPWTGSVCLGHGYVTCPGGLFLDDKNRCTREAPDAGAPDARAAARPRPRPPPVEPESTE